MYGDDTIEQQRLTQIVILLTEIRDLLTEEKQIRESKLPKTI
jgi:uncharacterized protein with ParB-like and HNH nuclease domain